MKHLLITLCVVLLTNTLFAQIKKEYYENGTLKSEGMYKNDVPDGQWKYYNKKGLLESEGQKKNGKLHGLWKVYNKTGSLNSTGKYENGVKVGEWKVYKTSGELYSKGNYVNGKKQGVFKYYTANEIKASGTFLNDQRNGKWVFYTKPGVTENAVYKKGKIISKETITEGLDKTDWIIYHTNQKKWKVGQKLNGQEIGLWTTYRSTNGARNYTQEYKNGKKDGTYTRYRGSGSSVAEKGQYINGQKEGKWMGYSISGKLRNLVNYKNGSRNGVYKHYYSTSKKGNPLVQESGQYVDGQRDGKWERYRLDGTVEKVSIYEKGKLKSSNSTRAIDKYAVGPSKNRAVNYKTYLLTKHHTQLQSLKDHKARVVKNQSIQIGPYKTFTYSKLKTGKNYLFYVICENTNGKPTVTVNGTTQTNFFSSTKEITKGSDKCIYYYGKKKGVTGARVTFSYSKNTNAQFVLIEQEKDWKKK